MRRYLLYSFPCPLPDVILTQKLSTFDIFYVMCCSTTKTWDSVVFALRHASFAAYFPLYLISQETFKRICTRKIITYFICTYLLISNTHELWLITLHHQNKSFAKVLNTVWTELEIIHTTTSIVSYNDYNKSKRL